MRSGSSIGLGAALALGALVLAFVAFQLTDDAFARAAVSALLGAVVAAVLVGVIVQRSLHDARRGEALLRLKAEEIRAISERLLDPDADSDADFEALLLGTRTLDAHTLREAAHYLHDRARGEAPRTGDLLAIMVRFRHELGADDPSAPAFLTDVRAALDALEEATRARDRIRATASPLYGALQKIAADVESGWRFEPPVDEGRSSVIALRTTDGLLEGRLTLPHPPEVKPRVEGSIEIRTHAHNLVLGEQQKSLRARLRTIGFGRPKPDEATPIDPQDRFLIHIVFDHPDEPYTSRANNLVDLLDDARDAIDEALAPPSSEGTSADASS
ncbi:MAG: hypothetical protein AB7S26_29870 [Sandaracinaceae bacterium]